MSVADNATLLDHGPKLRPVSFALRRSRIVPGPLKSWERRGHKRVWIAGLGLVGLSLVVTLAVAPHIRAGASTMPAPDPVVASEPAKDVAAKDVAAKDVAEPVRVVGVVPAPPSLPVPAVPVAIEDGPAEPAAAIPAESRPSLPAPAVAPSKPRSARPADLGPLPVLELDAAAFDTVTAPPIGSATPPAGRVAGRP